MKQKQKKNRVEIIEASLSKNNTTVHIEFSISNSNIKIGDKRWVSEDNAIYFVQNGMAKIVDKNYEMYRANSFNAYKKYSFKDSFNYSMREVI